MPTLGLADQDPDALAEVVLGAWDAFLDVADATDLARPSRLPGWSGLDVCTHLGGWDDNSPLRGLVTSARAGAPADAASPHPDATNAALIAAHRGASQSEVVAALVRAREAVEEFFDGDEPRELGRLPARSSLGPLPVLSVVHASCYELAVHALDLAPCGAPPAPVALLDRGLAALIDVTGALSARSGVDIEITAAAPEGGWAFRSGRDGWTTSPVAPGPFEGSGVRGTLADLLDASAGRTGLPQLLVTRRLVVQHLGHWMRLAPLVSEVPGLPGGAALRSGVAGLSGLGAGVTRLLGRRPGGR